MTQSDVTSPTVLLTGPTSGIGFRMFESLLDHPRRPHLVLLARDPVALERALETAHARGLTARGIGVDLSDLESVRGALEDLAAEQRRGTGAALDAALLNAGAQFISRRKTGGQGFELTFTVNVIAQHLLLRGLEPLLAPGGHVVLMGSSTHRGKRASFNLIPDPVWQHPSELATADPAAHGPTRFAAERERGGVAYASSKLALVTLAHDWAERLGGDGRRLNTYDPGLVAGTGLGKDMPGYMYWVWKNLMPAMSVLPGASTPTRSGRHAVELALGDAHRSLNDGYVEIGRLTAAEAVTFAPERRSALWEWLEGATAEFLPRPSARANEVPTE
jgi:NAD(P)-dependent dehydrogenase (short-subunit alcohol dehydrogenase family)